MKPCCRRMMKKSFELNWSSLPRDLLVVIAKLTISSSVEDLMAFGGVCRSWRSAYRDDEVVGAKLSSWPMMVPLLMLSEKEEGSREFYSILKRKIIMSLPVPKANNKKKFIESRFGWVLTLDFSGEVELMNPFSGARIKLPNYKTLPLYVSLWQDPCYDIILRSVLSANPSLTSDFVLVVTTTGYIAFWRIGNKDWTGMKSTNEGYECFRYLDVNYFNRDRRFYSVCMEGNIRVWDADASGGDFTNVVPHVIFKFDDAARVNIIGEYNAAYLVESSTGELLLVTRNGRFVKRDFRWTYRRYGATEFRVYRIDVINGVWERVMSLKNDAIFVGHNAAFSIPISDDDAGIIRSSSIYFTDDSISAYHRVKTTFPTIKEEYKPRTNREAKEVVEGNFRLAKCAAELGIGDIDAWVGGGKDMGIYNLEDGSIQRFPPEAETISFTCPPLWVAPSSFSWLRH